MVSNVTINVGVDDSSAQATLAQLQTKIDAQQVAWATGRKEANVEADALQAKIDEQQREWEIRRRAIMSEMSQVSQGINLLFQGIRTVVRAFGGTIDPIYSALMGIVSSTVSLMVATATAMATTGFLAPIAAVLMAATLGYSIGQTARLIEQQTALQARLTSVEQRMSRFDIRLPGGF